jgi:hypothetical protein
MKFRFPEILLGVFLTVAVFSMGMSFNWKPDASTPFENSTSFVHADTADERIARYTLWLAILTGGLVLASSFQFYFLNKAEKTSQTLAKLAREEFVATHRPRVVARFIQGPFYDNKGHEFIWLTFANIGETTATITAIGGDLARRNVVTRQWLVPGINVVPMPTVPIVLESGDRPTATIIAKASISDTELFADATEKYELCAARGVRYQDGNRRTRETAFFRTNNGGEGFTASKNREEEYED